MLRFGELSVEKVLTCHRDKDSGKASEHCEKGLSEMGKLWLRLLFQEEEKNTGVEDGKSVNRRARGGRRKLREV